MDCQSKSHFSADCCPQVQVHETVLEGLREHFLPLCEAEIRTQEETDLPQLNMPKGTLDSDDPKSLRCSCCSGEFLFSCVRLIMRNGTISLQQKWTSLSCARDCALLKRGCGAQLRSARACFAGSAGGNSAESDW